MPMIDMIIPIDEDLLSQFERVCEDEGLTVNEVLCLFMETAVREQRMPFEM